MNDSTLHPTEYVTLHLTAAAFLAGPRRSPAVAAWYDRQVTRLGGFPQLVQRWSSVPGVPYRLATAISTITHASAATDAFVVDGRSDTDVRALLLDASKALYADGDLMRTEDLLAPLRKTVTT